MVDVFYENNLFRACNILFGKDVNICKDFLLYIQESGIKSIFRQKALSSHPDKTLHLPEHERDKLKESFIELTWAYKLLIDFVDKRNNNKDNLLTWLNASAVNAAYETKPFNETAKYMRFYNGAIPSRPLLFGEFLYYSRAVTWKAFIEAIVWQRKQRPRFGDIALKWNYLDEVDLKYILEQKNTCEKVGETAIRLNLLNPSQVKAILLHQKLKQPKFGEYFINQGYLTRSKINEILIKHKIHNSSFNIRKVS